MGKIKITARARRIVRHRYFYLGIVAQMNLPLPVMKRVVREK
jgi:hypothetical protein